MNNPFLTIIIPVYNVEKYIGRCLKSIFSQGVDNTLYEVIVVNDGTPDNSMEIVSEFSEKYTNLKIINQVNQGLSMARNNGMKIAEGNYIWFIDSDDSIAEHSLERLFKVISSHKTEVIAILAQHEVEETKEIIKNPISKYLCDKEIVSGSDYLFDEGRESPAQLFIMSKSFLNKYELTFYPGILHEDIQFCLRMLYLAKDVYLLNEYIYIYLLRTSGSITSNYSIRNCNSYLKIAESLLDFRNKTVLEKDYVFYSAVLVKFLLAPLYHSKSNLILLKSLEYTDFLKKYKPYLVENIKYLLMSKRFHFYYMKIYVGIKFFFYKFALSN